MTHTKFPATPKTGGFHMPAEWEEHKATLLAWPHSKYHDFWGDKLRGAQDISLNIIKSLQDSEQVRLLITDKKMIKEVEIKAKKAKVDLDHVIFYGVPTYDLWTRDHGPIYIINSKGDIAMTHWIFNAWGNPTYKNIAHDTSVPARLNEIDRIRYFPTDMVLEGGSIEVNGKGILLTTKQCLLNKNRNPSLTQKDIGQHLIDYLGIEKIVWLNKGLINDDTNGHIDNLVRFATPETLLMADTTKDNENYSRIRENTCILERELSPQISFSYLPLPKVEDGGYKLAASYANFYIGNNVVLMPTFGKRKDENSKLDKQAQKILEKAFPSRKVIPINCLDLITSGGTIHCITQQIPKNNIMIYGEFG